MSAYSDAGKTFLRKLGAIGDAHVRDNNPNMTADASGHLYLYPGKILGQLQVYEKYGNDVLQSIQFRKGIFGALTLDDSGNLFAEVKNPKPKYIAGPVFEFPANGDGSLSPTPSRRLSTTPYWIATDPMGDVGASGGINGFAAYARKSKKPFWTLNADKTLYLSIAFDASNNLYAVEENEGSGPVSIDVYARGAPTPKYSITSTVYAAMQIALDGSGNLYVLNYCFSSCGFSQTNVSIYAPGATAPSTVLEPPAGTNFDAIGVSSAGYLAVIESEAGAYNGPVVVYTPGTTVPGITISNGLQSPTQVVFGN